MINGIAERKNMKVIIAGSRNITDFFAVADAIDYSKFKITEVVSGGARGVDALGESWAKGSGTPCKVFKAAWDDLAAKGAFIKQGPYGIYNVNAGRDRNEIMAGYADALIAVWDGKSTGTGHMIAHMRELGKPVHIAYTREK